MKTTYYALLLCIHLSGIHCTLQIKGSLKLHVKSLFNHNIFLGFGEYLENSTISKRAHGEHRGGVSKLLMREISLSVSVYDDDCFNYCREVERCDVKQCQSLDPDSVIVEGEFILIVISSDATTLQAYLERKHFESTTFFYIFAARIKTVR